MNVLRSFHKNLSASLNLALITAVAGLLSSCSIQLNALTPKEAESVTPPNLEITSPSPGAYVNNSNKAAFTISGSCSEDGRQVIFSGDASKTIICSAGTWSTTVDFSAASDGPVALHGDHSNADGDPASQKSRSFTKDTVDPTVAITSPAAMSNIYPVNMTTFAVSGTCSENGRSVTLSGAATGSATCAAGVWSANLDFSSASDGTITLYADHTDIAGNTATQASRNFDKDTGIPTLTITSPAANSYVTAANVTSFTVSGACSENGRNVVLTGDASGTVACAAGAWSMNLDFSAAAQGNVSITVNHSDAVGNAANSQSRTFIKDTVLPTVAITSPAASSYVNNANKAAFAVSGTCSENGRTVTISGAGSATPTCTAGAWSTTVNVTAASDGTITLYADHTDVAGNAATQDSRGFTKDVAAPAAPSGLALNSPASTPATSLTPTIQVSGVTSGDTIELYSDSSCTTSQGSGTASGATINITSSTLALGAYTFYAKATDPAGNASACSTANVAYTAIALNPATGLGWLENSPAPSNVINAAWTVSTSTISNQKLQFYSDATCTTPTGGLVDLSSATLQNYSFTGSAGGTYSFIVRSIDASSSSTDSSCSGGMTISSSLALSPMLFDYPIGAALSQTFTGSGGSGTGYTYTALSGPGSIDNSTGVYTSAVGNRFVGDTTQLRVTDSAAATALATVKHRRFTTDGTVYASVTDGTSLYLGGSFNWVSPDPAYGFVTVDTTTGASLNRTLASSFTGSINAIAIQGNTAYVGGQLTAYQGTTIQNLAKIDLITGQLDTTFTQSTGPNNSVNVLLISGSSLYVGGSFTTYRGNTKGYRLAKLDAKTGALETTNFNSAAGSGPNNNVNAIVISGSSLYIGGAFTNYRGDTKGYYLAKVDATTGALDTTNFNTVANSGPSSSILALALSGTSLYLGGAFTSYRGDTKGYYLAKVDATTGALDTTNFNTVANSGPNTSVYALALSGSSLYVGGGFGTYRGDSRGFYLAKVDATTGALDTTNFNTVANSGPTSTVYALALSGSSLYVGGAFTSYRGDSKGYRLVKVNATTGALDTTNFNPTANMGPNGAVSALALSGSTLAVGGGFSSYRGGSPAQNLAKIDIATGALDTTFTQSTGANSVVNALVLSGSSLYLGGVFTSYRGDAKGYRLAKVDATTGALDTTNFNTVGTGPSSTVNALAISGNALYVGGNFTSYRGDSKAYYLMKVDATTGVLDTTNFNTTANSGPSTFVQALAISGSSLYVGGGFTSYRGNPNAYCLAKVDATTGALDTANFNTSNAGPSSNVRTLLVSGTSLFVGGQFTSYRGDAKGAHLAKVDATTGALDTANFNSTAGPNSSVYALAISGTSLYVGGGFTSYRVNSKGYYLAKVDATSGAMDTTNFNTTAFSGPNGAVQAVVISGTQVFLGGSFSSYRGNTSGPVVFLDSTTGVEE